MHRRTGPVDLVSGLSLRLRRPLANGGTYTHKMDAALRRPAEETAVDWQGNAARIQGAGKGISSALLSPVPKPPNDAKEACQVDLLVVTVPQKPSSLECASAHGAHASMGELAKNGLHSALRTGVLQCTMAPESAYERTRAVLGEGVVVGEGAMVQEGAVLEAGSVVLPGHLIPGNQIWAGNPAAYVKDRPEFD